jgi:glucans biosynthesis protein
VLESGVNRSGQLGIELAFACPKSNSGCCSPHMSASLRGVAALRAAAAAAGATALLLAASAHAFDFDSVDQMARDLAARPYAGPGAPLPKVLKDLTYDQVRDIRFDPDHALWRADRLPFEIQFFHLGKYFEYPVRIHEISGGRVSEVRFDPAAFNYGANKLDRSQLSKLGFAGFRIHYPLNTPTYKDEVAVFLGASYFRVLGQGQRYGASARALAVDTADREEFPRFEQFWLEKPARGAKQIVIYALLDSRRVSGAYRFRILPGADTVVEVQSRLHLREPIGKLGLAPQTSMYYYGENQPPQFETFRPEVHDSDGLSIANGDGEWIWRPLINPRRLVVSSYALSSPRGFGLVQRDRSFASYEDLETRYDLRPTLWVEADEGHVWSAGRVELVQIPTPDETHDNIVAYWIPRVAPKPGVPLDVRYRLLALGATDRRPTTAWVTQSRRGRGYHGVAEDALQFTVDFAGPALARLKPAAEVEADVSVGGGAKQSVVVHHNDVRGGWRMVLHVRRTEKDKPLELRARLRHGQDILSETWSAIVPPQ